MSFWNSDLIKGLEKGQLPKIETTVTLDRKSLQDLYIGMFLVIALSMSLYFILKKLTD